MDGKPLMKFVPDIAACREARKLFIAFRYEGSARIVADYLPARV